MVPSKKELLVLLVLCFAGGTVWGVEEKKVEDANKSTENTENFENLEVGKNPQTENIKKSENVEAEKKIKENEKIMQDYLILQENKDEKKDEKKDEDEEEKKEVAKKIEENEKLIQDDLNLQEKKAEKKKKIINEIRIEIKEDNIAKILDHFSSYGIAYLGALTSVATKVIGKFFDLSMGKKLVLETVVPCAVGTGLFYLFKNFNKQAINQFGTGLALGSTGFYCYNLGASLTKKSYTTLVNVFSKKNNKQENLVMQPLKQ